MSNKKNFLKYMAIILVLAFIVTIHNKNGITNWNTTTRTSLYNGLRTVKITEEKSKINDKKVSIGVKMPVIHYSNSEVERYINTYIRKNINNFINHERQKAQIYNDDSEYHIDIHYHVVYADKNLLNLVIYRNKNWSKNKFELEKDSYVFDLKTGQRIYIDNFLKGNEDYIDTINVYIDNYILENKMDIDRNRINIGKNTDYIILQEGINVYSNPYKTDNDKQNYEFKIPYDIFKNKIKMVNTNDIVANIDTQTIMEDNEYISCIINIPIIMMESKDIEKAINDEIRNNIMSFYEDAKTRAEQYQNGFPDIQNKFVANADFKVKKNSDNMLSLLVEYYTYSGGAHGYYEYIPYNIDIRDGKNLSIQELFKGNANYKGVIDKEIRKQIDDIVKNDPQYKGIYEFKGIEDNQKFYIQDDNLVVYFDLYDIAPYAAGIPEFFININVINHILKDEYLEFFE